MSAAVRCSLMTVRSVSGRCNRSAVWRHCTTEANKSAAAQLSNHRLAVAGFSTKRFPYTTTDNCAQIRRLLSPSCTVFTAQHRYIRTGQKTGYAEQEQPKLPEREKISDLCASPKVLWPSFFLTLRNLLFSRVVIPIYIDNEFTMESFCAGAKQALVCVSQELSKGNFEYIKEVVVPPCAEEMQELCGHMSLKQRLDLAVKEDDIFFSFPYHIAILFSNKGTAEEQMFVEIMMCYHVYRDFQDYIKSRSDPESQGSIRGVYDNYDRISIANYKFIREYTKGVQGDWTISFINHFKPGEMMPRL